MFGLTFLNTVFLAGLAAAALPILIHLFSKKKAKDVPFPSIEYLREVSMRKVRRMRLRQWLLLALRVLIIALFAMAMGRPAIRGSGSPITRGSSTVGIVIDNSYSMASMTPELTGELGRATHLPPGDIEGELPGAAASGGATIPEAGTLFEQAKQRALEVLELMSDGDQAVLGLSGRPVHLPFQTPVANRNLIRQEITRAGLSATPSELPAAIDGVLSVLESARTINKELYVISDFQKHDLDAWVQRTQSAGGFDGIFDDAMADTLPGSQPESSFSLPEDVTVYLIPVRAETQENLAIERVRFDPTGGRSGAGQVVATVVNHGDRSAEDRVVRAFDVSSSSETLVDAVVSVTSKGQAEVELDLPAVPTSGKLEVRLGSDPLEWDNRAFVVTSEPGVQRVLVIGGSPLQSPVGDRSAEEDMVDDRLYIARALDPRGEGDRYEVETATVDALTDPAGLRADIVILSNVGRLSDAAVENLGRFRARGGGIFVVLGDRVDLRYYNNEILGRLSSAIELMNIMQEEGEGTYRSLRPIVLGHPIFQGFPISAGDDLTSARFQSIVECRVGEGARVIAEFSGQLPALIEEDGLVLFTSSLDGSWNEFPTSAAFVPTVHRVVRHLATRAQGERGPRTVGDRLETLVDAQSFQAPVINQDPLGGRGEVEVSPFGTMTRLRSDETVTPGLYDFVDASGEVVASFAVNLDADEGDLTASSEDAQLALFGRDAQRLEVGAPVTRELLEGRYGRELWQLFLVGVLILMAAESLIGRGRLLA